MKYPNMTWKTMEAIIDKLGGEKKARTFLKNSVQIVETKIFDFIDVVIIPAMKEKFVAKEKIFFKSEEVKFYGIEDNVHKWFLNDEKIEKPIGERKLCYSTLVNMAVDSMVISEIGSEAKAETTLSEVYHLLTKQPDAEKGVLITNGYSNIFYIRDASHVLRALRVFWHKNGWFLIADSIELSYNLNKGNCVFFRHSV